MTTSLPVGAASAEQVYERYRLRDWIEHYYKPVTHELGGADFQVRPAHAIVRHWHLVMLAYTFSLLAGAPQPDQALPSHAAGVGGKITDAPRLAGHLAPGARLALPLGPPHPLLAAVVHRATPSRAGRLDPTCGTVAAARRPNLTNQR
jgi:hypothetical protein